MNQFIVCERAGVVIQETTLIWYDADKHQPPKGTAVWVVLEELLPDGQAYGDRAVEFAEFSRLANEDGTLDWMLIGGEKIGPDHKVVAWAEPPELPPRFNADQGETFPDVLRLAP